MRAPHLAARTHLILIHRRFKRSLSAHLMRPCNHVRATSRSTSLTCQIFTVFTFSEVYATARSRQHVSTRRSSARAARGEEDESCHRKCKPVCICQKWTWKCNFGSRLTKPTEHRTGTLALYRAMQILGYNAYHAYECVVALAFHTWEPLKMRLLRSIIGYLGFVNTRERTLIGCWEITMWVSIRVHKFHSNMYWNVFSQPIKILWAACDAEP